MVEVTGGGTALTVDGGLITVYRRGRVVVAAVERVDKVHVVPVAGIPRRLLVHVGFDGRQPPTTVAEARADAWTLVLPARREKAVSALVSEVERQRRNGVT